MLQTGAITIAPSLLPVTIRPDFSRRRHLIEGTTRRMRCFRS